MQVELRAGLPIPVNESPPSRSWPVPSSGDPPSQRRSQSARSTTDAKSRLPYPLRVHADPGCRVCPCPAPNLERHEPTRQSYGAHSSDTAQTEKAPASTPSTNPLAMRTRAMMLIRFEPAMWLCARPISPIPPNSAAVQGVNLGRPDVGRESMKLTNPRLVLARELAWHSEKQLLSTAPGG